MSYENTDPAGARELVQGEHDVIDVRSVEEFEEGHVPGAYNVPLLFRGAMGMSPNPAFLEVMLRHFARDRRLVFV